MCTARCGIIRQERPLSEGTRRPVAMQPLSERTRRPQSYATSIRTHQAPGGVPGGFAASGRTAASPNAHFFFADVFSSESNLYSCRTGSVSIDINIYIINLFYELYLFS